MTKHYSLDYETRSRADIKEVGAFRYAADPSTEIFCAAIARDDGEPLVWVNPAFEFDDGMFVIKSDPGAQDLLLEMLESDAPIYSHNAVFEHAVTMYVGNRLFRDVFATASIPDVDYRRWRCTAAMARRAAIPASLEKAAEALGVEQQKDSKGKSLIRLFSIPQKTGEFHQPKHHGHKFKAFLEYCAQDIRTEQAIHRKLKAFELTGPVLETFQLDLAINSRGLTVNMGALQKVQKLIDHKQAELTAEFQQLTGLMPTQNMALLPWLKERGYPGDNLQAATMDEQLDGESFDDSSEFGRALVIKKSLSYTSIKKIKSMLACAHTDGRVRGTLQFYGASTGRWSGRLIQPQNFKRPTIKNTGEAYADLCDGGGTPWIEVIYGPLLEVVSSCIRHFIHDPKAPLFDVDYSAIEARIVNWLAGNEDALEEYRNKVDRYKRMASVIFNVPINEVNSFPQRFIGKQTVLGCGYGMGPPKFRFTCEKFGYKDMPEGLEEKAVKAFRSTHKPIVDYWYANDRAAKAAIRNPGQRFAVGRGVEYFAARTAGANYLFLRLPSGRRLAYRDPKIDRVPIPKKPMLLDEWDWDHIEGFNPQETKYRDRISYWGPIDGKAAWGRVDMYGGKFVENCTQAVAADIMANGALVAEKNGFEIATLIHDQCLAYNGDESRLDLLCKCLVSLPKWGDGLPIDVEGKVVPYYTKD